MACVKAFKFLAVPADEGTDAINAVSGLKAHQLPFVLRERR